VWTDADEIRARCEGLTASQIKAEKQRREDEQAFYVEPELWEGFGVFMAMQTQWNIVSGIAGGSLVGLRYESLPFMFDLYQVKNKVQAFGVIQRLEQIVRKGAQ
jgi:Phage related hypothetical protein (DUF1799)